MLLLEYLIRILKRNSWLKTPEHPPFSAERKRSSHRRVAKDVARKPTPSTPVVLRTAIIPRHDSKVMTGRKRLRNIYTPTSRLYWIICVAILETSSRKRRAARSLLLRASRPLLRRR
jgi:hypothetical protein